jgi:hypothetical protein
MKTLPMIIASSISLTAGAAEQLLECPGLVTDKTPGWRFEASAASAGETFNPLEGWYPDKGGKLVSPRIPLPKANAYYRISFTASAPVRSYEAVAFYDADDKMVADNYDVVYGCEVGEKCSKNEDSSLQLRTPTQNSNSNHYSRVVFAQEGVKTAEIFFQSTKGCTVSDVKFEQATAEEAAAWCDKVYSRLPPVAVETVDDAFLSAPKTRDALKTGKPWRILLLGDSIIQDTFHSQFHALVKRAYPKSDVTWLVSVRGSTGCWFYRKPENFASYVAAYRPDCVIVGGISNWPKATDEFPVTGNDAIFKVGDMICAMGAELIVMSPALSVDTRLPKGADILTPVPPRTYDAEAEAEALGLTGYAPSKPDAGLSPRRFAELKSGCAERGWGFVDAFSPTYRWLYESGRPYQFYSRDHVHSGELGKQIIGRVMLAFLRPILTDAGTTSETDTANR